jgi:endo-1,4-beta-xylanase
MKNKWILKAAITAGIMVASAGPAYAQCGGTGTTGTYLNTFWSWYTAGGNNGDDCLDIPAKNTAVAVWNLGDRGNDAVGGIGRSKGVYDTSYYYKFEYFYTGNKSKSYGGLYGWSCNDNRKTPQEYYIIDNYDGNSFVPFGGGTAVTSFKANGGTYKVYIINRPSSPNACTGSTPAAFTQYWSVRTSKRFEGTISTKGHFDQWSSGNRGFRTGGIGEEYQIIGVEGVDQSDGGAKWTISF